jgi:hypothetical protein
MSTICFHKMPLPPTGTVLPSWDDDFGLQGQDMLSMLRSSAHEQVFLERIGMRNNTPERVARFTTRRVNVTKEPQGFSLPSPRSSSS